MSDYGVVVRSPTRLRELVVRADGLGYTTICAADHVGAYGPFAVLATAAAASERMRLRTYVLNAGFWNPALLAREVATLDLLSGGRVEVGVGAGHMRGEFVDAGIAWHGPDARWAIAEQLLSELRRRLADPEDAPRPVQSPVPLAVGAMSDRGLAVAARHADIVAFAGLNQAVGHPPGTFALASAAETDRRVAEVRALAGDRRYRSDALLQVVAFGDPERNAAALAADSPALTVESLLDSPFVLLAADREAAAESWSAAASATGSIPSARTSRRWRRSAR